MPSFLETRGRGREIDWSRNADIALSICSFGIGKIELIIQDSALPMSWSAGYLLDL